MQNVRKTWRPHQAPAPDGRYQQPDGWPAGGYIGGKTSPYPRVDGKEDRCSGRLRQLVIRYKAAHDAGPPARHHAYLSFIPGPVRTARSIGRLAEGKRH